MEQEEERKATLAIQDIVGLRFHDHTHHNHQPTTTPPCKRINCLHMLPRFDMIMIVIFPRFFRGKMKTENALKRWQRSYNIIIKIVMCCYDYIYHAVCP